jgi:hypothetical protein
MFVKLTCILFYSPVNENGLWRTKCSNELYMLYDELNIVRVIKIGKLMWLGQPFRMQELDPCTNVNLLSQNALTCRKT